MSKWLLMMSMVFLFVGCSLKEVEPAKTKFSLELGEVQKSTMTPSLSVLKIARFKASDHLNSEYIWYRHNGLQLDHYQFSTWSDNFLDMLQRNMAYTLFKSELFKSVFSGYSSMSADLLLEGEVLGVSQEIVNDTARVHVEIRLYLVTKEKSVLRDSKLFSYTKDCESVNAIGAVKAYNEIMKNLNKDTILWLERLVSEN